MYGRCSEIADVKYTQRDEVGAPYSEGYVALRLLERLAAHLLYTVLVLWLAPVLRVKPTQTDGEI